MSNALLDGIFVLDSQIFPILTITILIVLGYTPILLFVVKKRLKSSFLVFSLLTLLLLLSLILRLAYIRDIILPPYFDSAEHIRIINAIIEAWANSASTTNLTPTYYHIGFHILAAILVMILKIKASTLVLIFGQVILALFPLPIFLFIWHKTQSEVAALFASVLASFTWSMPGFSINWGKYPMLTGLFLGISALLYTYLLGYNQNKTKKERHWPFGLLILGILAAILTHSRILIFFLIAGISWWFAQKTPKLQRSRQIGISVFMLALIIFLGWLISRNELLKLTLEPYLSGSGIYYTALIVALIPFTLKRFSRFFYFSLAFIAGLFLSLFISLGDHIQELRNLTLLDRPFVEATLFLPLALIGGLGFAEVVQKVNLRKSLNQTLAILLLVGVFSFQTLRTYTFTPSPCCNFVQKDDITLMTWIENNLPTDARIAISATPLNVTPGTGSKSLTGADAGIWVFNLTGRQILLVPYSHDFSAKETKDFLCEQSVNYIYAGNQPFSFNKSLHTSNNEWYEEVLSLPNARLYALKGCKN